MLIILCGLLDNGNNYLTTAAAAVQLPVRIGYRRKNAHSWRCILARYNWYPVPKRNQRWHSEA